MKLRDALCEEALRKRLLRGDWEDDAAHALHKIGVLTRSFVEHVTLHRVPVRGSRTADQHHFCRLGCRHDCGRFLRACGSYQQKSGCSGAKRDGAAIPSGSGFRKSHVSFAFVKMRGRGYARTVSMSFDNGPPDSCPGLLPTSAVWHGHFPNPSFTMRGFFAPSPYERSSGNGAAWPGHRAAGIPADPIASAVQQKMCQQLSAVCGIIIAVSKQQIACQLSGGISYWNQLPRQKDQLRPLYRASQP